MKQLLQDPRSGDVWVEEAAAPHVRPGHLLIRTTRSLISAGTERMLLDFGKAGYLGKTRQQPERVREVMDKVRTDGLGATVDAVRSKLDQPLPMGYSNVGRVLAVGDGVQGFEPGDRVVSNGRHAEIVLVPKNLCAKVPDEVTDDQATFTVIGSVALQGIRLLDPTLGESVAVFGLGLVGLLAVQILQANGARVLGFDTDPGRVELARRFGITAVDLSMDADPVADGRAFSGGGGIDGVLVTASTSSDEVLHQAAQMSRKRGRIILTGTAGLNLRRADFYEKELRFQVSCSYGPGRYDPGYEELGHDYPLGFVRWTEQRNFEAVLDLLATGRLRIEDLVSERVPFDDASRGYEMLSSEPVLGIVFEYPEAPDGRESAPVRVVEHAPRRPGPIGRAVGAIVGAGTFAQRTLLPALQATDVRLKWVASTRGLSGSVSARRFGIERSTTDLETVLDDPEVDFVVIGTRHDSHASLAVRALEAGKSVFVEKPLCLNREELERIRLAYEDAARRAPAPPILMVGFNRRFAPLTVEARRRLGGRQEPLAMVYTCNAGPIPADHWVHDPEIGGGRIIGEACHFIDLLAFLAGAPVEWVVTTAPEGRSAAGTRDTATISLGFRDGSSGQVHYFANGSKRYPKERLEVFGGGRVLCVDNFRRLKVYGQGAKGRGWLPRAQDKGHRAEIEAFVGAVERGEESPIPFESALNTTEATFAAVESLAESRIVRL